MTKVKKAMNEEEILTVKTFLEDISHNAKPDADRGSCVLGNGIEGVMVRRGKRLPERVMLFDNPWTQTEQPKALGAMLEAAKSEFPHLAQYLHYSCGNMD